MSSLSPLTRRALGERRERLIREGLAPGCVWIAFPQDYARQLLRELDLTRRERDEARDALARYAALDARAGGEET
jgi:hypothetical protein